MFDPNLKNLFLASFKAQAIVWSIDLLKYSSDGFTIISANIDIFEIRIYENRQNNASFSSLKVGTAVAKLGFNLNDIFGGEVKATALTIGAYSDYIDFEILVGSVSLTAKIENGKLKIGFSLGIGFELSIKLWSI